MSANVNDWNARIIEEFRANGGKVGGQFAGIPILLLHTVGAKSGATRINPLAFQPLENGYAIFGSFAGAPKHPAWYHNVLANPDVEIEVEDRREKVRARVAEGTERTEIWERQKAAIPTFAQYEENTSREIPVVVLEPAA